MINIQPPLEVVPRLFNQNTIEIVTVKPFERRGQAVISWCRTPQPLASMKLEALETTGYVFLSFHRLVLHRIQIKRTTLELGMSSSSSNCTLHKTSEENIGTAP